MIELDTNVTVRYGSQNDPRQSQRVQLVAQALARFSSGGADFADALIERMAAAAGCTTTMTFDQGAVKTTGMTLVP